MKKLGLGFLDGEESFEAISKVNVYKFAPWMGIFLYTCFYNALFISMKTLCQESFSVFGSIRKISQRKTIFNQHKKYDLLLEIVFH